MQRHIFAVAVLIFILSLTVGGVTAAYFTDEISLPFAEFTAGTVEIEVDRVTDDDEIEFEDGYEGTAKWKIKNTGSKKAYLRAKFDYELDGEGGGGGDDYDEDDPTAWAVGYNVKDKWQEDASSPRFGGGNARYHVYSLGHTESNPLELKLGAGATYHNIGTVQVWDDGTKIFIEARTDGRYRFVETHLYIGSKAPTNSAPGQMKEKLEIEGNFFAEYKGELPEGIKDDEVYIALHAALLRTSSGSGGGGGIGYTPDIDLEIPGWTKGGDGYYYYDDIVDPGKYAYFKIEFEVDAQEGWSGECEFWIEAEAVQASHGAINVIWPDNPLNDD